MERSTGTDSSLDQSTEPSLEGESAHRHLRAARVALRELGALAAASGDGSLAGASVAAQVQGILGELDGVDGEGGAPRRVPCGFCGRLIMPAASLCGYCWHAHQAQGQARAAPPSLAQT